MTRKIIIIRGNSGSGKSTVAKELQTMLGRGTMLISQDLVRRDMLHTQDRPNNKAIDLMQNLVTFAYEHCEIAILEGILYYELYSKLFSTVKELYANNIHAYYFDLSFEETLKRHASKPNADDFGEERMRQWWREKDYLPNISEKLLGVEMNKEDIVDLIYNDVLSIRKEKL